jgi:pyrroline-5-carboxylate reductase
MIPNAPSLIGRGYNPVAFGDSLNDRGRTTLRTLYAAWGQAPEVPEAHLEAYALLTGMGPTYFWYQWQALRELASEFSLTASEADVALDAMVAGALATLCESGLSPAEVMDLIPVKPLADVEAGLASAYRTVLPALYAKIRPSESAAV